MTPGRGGRSLGERAAASGVPTEVPVRPAVPEPGPAYAAAGDGGEGRHCWVHDPPESAGTWPGLLVEWRQRADGWHGRVAYTVVGAHGPVLVEAWLPADQLKQG